MFIDIIPLQKNTARLTRVYGDAPCAALPASVPGPEGGVLAITELGDYCFSEKPRSLPRADTLCRYEVSPDGTCALVQAFGRNLTGRHGRYDLDFGEGAAAPEELHPVCGNFVEEVILPDSLQVIGSCAFYNCRGLRRLSVGAGDLTVGSDVFLNCFALADLLVRAAPEEKTGLFALVNNITEAVRALFWLPGEARPRAGLWYPAYWEDVEESPAHILLHTFSGQGYHYRQCFLENKLLPAEYDAIFPQGHDADDAAVMAMLLGFSPKFGALIHTIPSPVIGGASIVVFGLIAVAGARIWVQHRVDLSQNGNLIMVAVTLVLGAGDFALTLGGFTIGGIGTATFGAILLNALLSRRMAAAPQGAVVHQDS